MFKYIDTRGRAVITSILIGMFLFVFINPIPRYIYNTIVPPSQVQNIFVEQKSREVDLSWSKNTELNLQGYVITLNGNKIIDQLLDNKSVDNYHIYNLQNDTNYSIKLEAIDLSGKVSKSNEFNAKPSEQINNFTINPIDEVTINNANLLFLVLFLTVILFVLNLWVLFFKVNLKRVITIALFPPLVLIPYYILTLSLLLTFNSQISKFIFTSIISVICMFLTYLLILTSNILNGSMLLKQLPLEQAAKAAQFIFGLISTYLMLIYVFNSNLNVVFRLLIVLLFILYFTYSSLSVVKVISNAQILDRSFSVTLTMSIVILVMSVWPIESIYAILTIAVIYYILLNITLEVRKNVGISLWVEYSVLLLLIIFLLFTNGVWGIKGTII